MSVDRSRILVGDRVTVYRRGKKGMYQADFYAGSLGLRLSKVVSPQELAQFLSVPRWSVYQWQARGRLQGGARKRGKHLLILKERALQGIFNGPECTHDAR
ncbi:MAG TPA: hypothetical protein PKC18_07430 [Lacipirellulaceae bacterium]|nr:hypothetical protein [Lacipirellulaceae bacterium]HMP06336.1 hypothetical protein [Lacipirellulaceae bacterium]